ncbi:MAG: hypothetical protein M1834_008814 [Cirrosporium novae-zelandiae]|nr:MAG: hypothetical protein M1834_008814 [Cirrosporium novae-zelandiae]
MASSKLTSGGRTILHLPPEIIFSIFDNLSIETLKALRLTNKHLSSHTLQYLFRTVRLELSRSSLDELHEKAKAYGPYMKELVIDRNWLLTAPERRFDIQDEYHELTLPAENFDHRRVDLRTIYASKPWLTAQFDFVTNLDNVEAARSLIRNYMPNLNSLTITNTGGEMLVYRGWWDNFFLGPDEELLLDFICKIFVEGPGPSLCVKAPNCSLERITISPAAGFENDVFKFNNEFAIRRMARLGKVVSEIDSLALCTRLCHLVKSCRTIDLTIAAFNIFTGAPAETNAHWYFSSIICAASQNLKSLYLNLLSWENEGFTFLDEHLLNTRFPHLEQFHLSEAPVSLSLLNRFLYNHQKTLESVQFHYVKPIWNADPDLLSWSRFISKLRNSVDRSFFDHVSIGFCGVFNWRSGVTDWARWYFVGPEQVKQYGKGGQGNPFTGGYVNVVEVA